MKLQELQKKIKEAKRITEALKKNLRAETSTCGCERFSSNQNEYDLYISTWLQSPLDTIEEMIEAEIKRRSR